ncbi:DUF5103 domain-containing protein [Parabacteroides sp. PF5-6]|uniref:type IX secretion system plug protein n=1 Tax=Parabacteroides sp. PF5-6 TaxID=1742403 RepID=UPI0024063485|nr:DUF5103 domain-containing protein [Parabacteroides sp. PF5-6]
MRYLALFLFVLSVFSLSAQEIYQTDVYDKMVKSLQVGVAGESLSSPYITLNGEQAIGICFDVLEEGHQRYAYSIVHCDADWKPSSLIPMEYINGFQGLPIEEYAPGMGTTVSYTNYYLELPNADIQFKVSGNYAVRIYREDQPDETVLTACFYVVEEQELPIMANLTTNTLIDTNRSHQQINFSLNTSRFTINHPQTDLKIWVYQNNRRDNAVSGIMPSTIGGNRIEYANLRELIFEAGNEYRRFEFLSTSYNGMHIEELSFHNPYYHATLYADAPRSRSAYQYDQDQNGRYLINCRSCNYPDTEADYFVVHFALDIPPLLDGKIYILGDLFHNVLDEKSRINYNPKSNLFEKVLLLKQGHYNYQYLFVPNGEKKGTTALFEGNYALTENEYAIHIYYRPMGERYDRLIGVNQISGSF